MSSLNRTPKVQIWIRRNQMKLSGKRTLLPNHSGKFVLQLFNCWRNDTDGVKF